MLGRRRRRRASIDLTLVQVLVFAGLGGGDWPVQRTDESLPPTEPQGTHSKL